MIAASRDAHLDAAPDAPSPERAMDWEQFFSSYREPDFVPGFTISNKLGSGVFGEVYKAERTSIGKPYAIKFLRLQDERLHEQVLRELDSLQHLAQVDHPNLVTIEDRGEVCGIPYIVMGYAGDETLKSLLQDGPIHREQAVALFRQVLQGVAALHDRSIIHFDLKPANIFINGDAVRVGDYGLSKLVSESGGTLSMGRGTPYYMAPEMLRRRGDARSDVYSLGVILYELLVGDVPFKGDSEWEILRRHERESPSIPETLPGKLRSVIARCLEKKPRARFANAGEVLCAMSVQEKVVPEPPEASLAPPDSGPASHSPDAEAWGVRAGRMLHGGKVSLGVVRAEIGGLLKRVRAETGELVSSAQEGYRRAETERRARADGAVLGPGGALGAAPNLAGRRAVLRPAKGRSRSFLTGLLAPIRALAWVVVNGLRIVVVLALILALCSFVHLGLEALIL